ncbi:MAG TPA: ABC transporter permease [Dehalococcoidia bacterium]|nr:ABC transporter permease [Dehalococcoidia bacterium]
MTERQQAIEVSPVIDFDYRSGASVRRALQALWRMADRNRLGAFGMALVMIVLAAALFGPLIKRYGDTQTFETANPDYNPLASPLDIVANPQKQYTSPVILRRWEPPLTGEHWLGTDQFGRDIYARIIAGARLAVIIGVGASFISVAAGTVLGTISGYFGGLVDLILQRFVDAVFAFPGLVLLLLLVSVVDQPSLALTVAVLGFLGFASSTRVVRSTVLSVSQMAYVEAARSYGASDLRLMLRHVLPNIFATVVVIFSISIGLYILAEAGLSFLGLGPADQTTWGKMVNNGRHTLDLHPWESVFAGLAITLAVLGFNLAGDALRDELDPRLRGR